MLRVGLTGGIATGKSFVSSVLREQGCEVADADRIAHQVIEPGQPAYAEIFREFSGDVPELISETGAIDRARLGAFVFAHPARLQRLNAIVHPQVFAAQEKWFAEIAARDPQAIAVVDAALMIETGSYRRFDKVIVAYCEPQLQLERLMARNNLSREAAQARIATQMPTAEKLSYADYTINTSGSFDETRRQVEAVFLKLKELASDQPPGASENEF
jgi:dephospho-CoA kinase